MILTPNNRKFDDMLSAIYSHMDGRVITYRGERGKVRWEIGQIHAAFGTRTPDRLMHEPAKGRLNQGLACITDLAESEDLFDIARRNGFGFASWGY